jgi:hypothetical protein
VTEPEGPVLVEWEEFTPVESREFSLEGADLVTESADMELRLDGKDAIPQELVVNAPRFDAKTRSDQPLIRENTARHLALGVGIAFAVALLFVCVGHVISLKVALEPPPASIQKDGIEAWFRWRQQVGDQANGFAQTIGTLLAGPFGVVLGFYFRDRK